MVRVNALTWGIPPKRGRKGKLNNQPAAPVPGRPLSQDDYAGTLLEFHTWCEQRKLFFREEMLRLVVARMDEKKTI